MPLETEIKLRVGDHGVVRSRLQAAGAKYVRRELETNTFLDTADSTLLRSGCGLRVRLAKNVEKGSQRVVITHKGPKRPGPMKIRPETEATAESYDDAVKLLGALGYEVKLSFEKRRETWELGDCEVVLDELPENLGKFVEIEGENEACVQAIRTQLGLTELPVEPEGYAVLVARHLQPAGRKTLSF